MPNKTAIKVRIYPNKIQQELLNKTFGCCQFLHNKMLDERKSIYNLLKDDKNQLYNHKYKTEKDYKKDFQFLKEVDSKALQSETRNLIQLIKTFLEG